MIAEPINNVFIPSAAYSMDGKRFLEFKMETGDYTEFKHFPNGVRYNKMTYKKIGYNSDKNYICYRECCKFELAKEIF